MKVPKGKPIVTEMVNVRYGIAKQLGEGGMGSVFETYDFLLCRYVALKRCHLEGEKWRMRFEQEAKAQAKLSHPNIVSIFDFGHDERKQPFIVMEYFQSRSVQDLLGNRRTMEFDEAMRIARTAARALSYVHECKLVHRDVKPSNMLIDDEGVIKLADFGLAKIDKGDLTQLGENFGTPGYVAPEQTKNAKLVDHRADIYSLGLTVVAMLTGSPGHIQELGAKPAVSKALLRMLERSVSPKVEDRPASIDEFLYALPAPRFNRLGTPEAVTWCKGRKLNPISRADAGGMLVYGLGEIRLSGKGKKRTVEGYAFDAKRSCEVYIVRMHESGQLTDKRAYKAHAEYGAMIAFDEEVLSVAVTTGKE